MAKKKESKAKPKDKANPNHKEDFIALLSNAVKPIKKEAK
jgi:hypothetical protein